MWWEKIIQRKSPHFLQKFTAFFFPSFIKSDYRNIIKLSDCWRSGIRSWRNAGGGRLERVYGSFVFIRTPRTRWKSNSPRFTGFHHISYKNSPPSLDPRRNIFLCSQTIHASQSCFENILIAHYFSKIILFGYQKETTVSLIKTDRLLYHSLFLVLLYLALFAFFRCSFFNR